MLQRHDIYSLLRQEAAKLQGVDIVYGSEEADGKEEEHAEHGREHHKRRAKWRVKNDGQGSQWHEDGKADPVRSTEEANSFDAVRVRLEPTSTQMRRLRRKRCK